MLPSNFEEVATGVLKVLNNLALIDISFIQKMLVSPNSEVHPNPLPPFFQSKVDFLLRNIFQAQPDLKMEFFHLMSFILSHCTSNWGVANDKVIVHFPFCFLELEANLNAIIISFDVNVLLSFINTQLRGNNITLY